MSGGIQVTASVIGPDDTLKVIPRASLRTARPSPDTSKRLDPIDGENIPQIVKFHKDDDDTCENDNGNPTEDKPSTPMPTFNPTDLIGRSFLYDTQDGQRQRIKIIEAINAHESLLYQDPIHLQF